MENQIVIFEIGQEYFGVDIAIVESIINLRGKVLPIIDLRKRFGFLREETNQESRIIVVSAEQTEVGMIVDEVSEVLTLPAGAVEAAPAIATTVDSAFIKGIAKLGPNDSSSQQEERLIILLDLTEVLSVREKNTLESISA